MFDFIISSVVCHGLKWHSPRFWCPIYWEARSNATACDGHGWPLFHGRTSFGAWCHRRCYGWRQGPQCVGLLVLVVIIIMVVTIYECSSDYWYTYIITYNIYINYNAYYYHYSCSQFLFSGSAVRTAGCMDIEWCNVNDLVKNYSSLERSLSDLNDSGGWKGFNCSFDLPLIFPHFLF